MSNGINEFSPEIRDFLLNRNLILSDTVTKNGLTNSASGLGLQAKINSESSVIASRDIEDSGIEFRNDVINNNKYISNDDMVSATLFNNSIAYSQIDGGYIDKNRKLNLGGSSSTGLDILTSLTSEEGFGLNSNGFYSQNNINSSITGRVLGGLGAINDTPLGIIGGQQLLLALGQRTSFNAQKELNLNPIDLLRGEDFLKPDYSITVSNPTNNKIANKIIDLTGFEVPFSKFDMGTSIFDEGGLKPNKNYLIRNNTIIDNSGKGQIERLFENIEENTFKPNYESSKFGLKVDDAQEYKKIETSDYNRSGDVIWDPYYNVLDDTDDNKISLLSKTKKLFGGDVLNLNEVNPDFYESMFGLQGKLDIEKNKVLTTPSSNGRLSKGSGVVNSKNEFCRTWGSTKQYSKVGDLQKNSGLYNTQTRSGAGYLNSILGSNGFVKVSPYKTPSNGENSSSSKKFMFSIENLAWNDSLENLPEYEIGSGDETTGTKGRIMWFPPYDIKFSESSNVNWDKTSFIGRGEPIYTYNNTERSGNLSFKVIIDHPDYLNNPNLETDDIMASIAAGCSDLSRLFSVNEVAELDRTSNDLELKETISNDITVPDDLYFYFPNDSSIITNFYEYSGGTNPNPTNSEGGFFSDGSTTHNNATNFGLNEVWQNTEFINNLKEEVKSNKTLTLSIIGGASKAGININDESASTINKRLSDSRVKWVIDWLKTNISKDLNIIKSDGIGSEKANAPITGDVDSKNVKTDRKVKVTFTNNIIKDDDIKKSTDDIKTKTINRKFKSNIRRRFFNESQYFEELSKSETNSDKVIYQTLREKIKFFHPAFHSTTPEGFNSRLTFINQCTRQGATKSSLKSKNLAFGAPPVCILRIGDFYNTKIIINNVNISFDPLVWDLNPEGIGVQPMIANVEISFNFIGGSSLEGPINRLQNAVSFNYFANSEIYDPRSDTLENVEDLNNSGVTKKISDGITKFNDLLSNEGNTSKNNTISDIDEEARLKSNEISEDNINYLLTPKSNRELLQNLRVTNLEKSILQVFSISLDWGEEPAIIDLRKEFTADVIIRDNNFVNNSILIGKIKATPNDGEIIITPIGSGLIGNQTLSSNSSNFDIEVGFDNNNEIFNFISDLKNGDGGYLELNWRELKVKSNLDIKNIEL